MDELEKKLIAENKAMREGKRIEIFETLLATPKFIPDAVTEASGTANSDGTFEAIVGEMNVLNGNHRVYTDSEWNTQIDRANDPQREGMLLGAVDHQGCAEGGNLKNTPIVWQGLEVGEATVAMQNGKLVTGKFKLADTAAGRDLKALIDAKAKIGFSTFGYAEGREPTEEERKQYGIAEDDENAVIIQNWELVKIDAVDNPSVRKARLKTGESQTQPGAKEGKAMEIKTLEDLKAKLPDIFKLHESAITATSERVSKELADKIAGLEATIKELTDAAEAAKPKLAKYDALVKKLADSLNCLADEHGVERPYKEVTAKEADEKLAKLAADLDAANKAIATEKDAAKAANDKLAAIEAEKVEAKRVADVLAKGAELAKGNKYEAVLKDELTVAAKDTKFAVEGVDAWVKDRIATFEKVAAALKPAVKPNFEITGHLDLPEDAQSENTAPTSVAAMAEML